MPSAIETTIGYRKAGCFEVAGTRKFAPIVPPIQIGKIAPAIIGTWRRLEADSGK